MTQSGLKLLDFGLALVNDNSAVGIADAPTVLSMAGAVMGTVPYMSPEQAQGKPADARSDIFSLGLVLYEMLSGRQAFAGDSAIDTISASRFRIGKASPASNLSVARIPGVTRSLAGAEALPDNQSRVCLVRAISIPHPVQLIHFQRRPNSMSVKLNTRQVNDVSVIDVSGRITLGEGSSVIRDAMRDLTARGNKKILLNLGDVSYIDSSGVGELVSGYTSVTNAGGSLKLLNLTKRVKDLLQITKLYTVFDVHEDEAHALRSFA